MLPVPQGKMVMSAGSGKSGTGLRSREFVVSEYLIDLRPVSVEEFVGFLDTLLPRENGRIVAAPSRQGAMGQLEPPDEIKRLVRVPSYWLVLGEGGFVLNGVRGDAPMFNVTWDGADAYCRHVGKNLPSETQWEKACAGSVPAYKVTDKYEWASDWYSADFFRKAGPVDPLNTANTGLKSSRGGVDSRGKVRCSARSGAVPSAATLNKAFRCAKREAKEEGGRYRGRCLLIDYLA